jgi:hypothetical protein
MSHGDLPDEQPPPRTDLPSLGDVLAGFDDQLVRFEERVDPSKKRRLGCQAPCAGLELPHPSLDLAQAAGSRLWTQ